MYSTQTKDTSNRISLVENLHIDSRNLNRTMNLYGQKYLKVITQEESEHDQKSTEMNSKQSPKVS